MTDGLGRALEQAAAAANGVAASAGCGGSAVQELQRAAQAAGVVAAPIAPVMPPIEPDWGAAVRKAAQQLKQERAKDEQILHL